MLVQSYVFLSFYRHIISHKAECNQVATDILYFCTCKKNHNKNIIMKDETRKHTHHHHEHEHQHEHHHEHGGMKNRITVICLTALLLVGAVFIEKNCDLPTWQMLLVYLVPYLLIGHGTLKEALEGIFKGDMLNEDFLMSIATIGALCIGFLPGAETEFPEAVFVMLFFQVGELFEGYAEGRSRDSISHLMNIRPDYANVERDGTVKSVSPEEVTIGETIVVKPGEKVPLDGQVIEGTSSLNTIALTGESMPREVTVGEDIASGCINLSGVLRVRTSKTFGESTVSKIIRLVESADKNKSRSESFITKFARIYTPIVVATALLLAFIPPFFANLGTVVFDKTGTLTKGVFAVEAVHPDHFDANEILHLAAHVEHYSTHPIGAALRDAFPNEATDGCHVTDVEEIAGRGVKARIGGRLVAVGNSKMMEDIGAEWHNCHRTGTIVHVAVDGVYAGHVVINDVVKEDSAEAISKLRGLGIIRTVMLTGDRKEVGDKVAEELGIDECHAELLPADKVDCMERLIADKPEGKTLAFVGDGINDAPVLKRADVGIAMGGLGSDAAIEAADVVLMDDHPSKIATAVEIARRTIAIAKQNVWFAIGVKVAILLLATVGLGTMWMAVFADVGVTVLAVLNAMRALKG